MNKRLAIALVIVIVAVATTVGLIGTRTTGSSKGARLLGSGRPTDYRILYRVQQSASSPTTVRWEVLSARRPFDVRKVSFANRPQPGDRPDSGTLTDLDHLYVVKPDGLHLISGRQPGVGTSDQALAPIMAAAVVRGLAKPLGTRSVAGRKCRDYRFLEPPAGPIKRLQGNDNDVLCIDADGLVLREAYTLQGRLVQLREAEEVTFNPPGLAEELDASAAVPSTDANAPTAEPLPEPAAAAPALPSPAGFTPVAVDAFTLPAPKGSGGPQVLYRSTVWAFRRGPDVVTVEAGGGGGLPWDDRDPSRSVTLPVGRADSVMRSDGPELRVDLGGGRWLRVRGTISPEALTAYARTLPPPTG